MQIVRTEEHKAFAFDPEAREAFFLALEDGDLQAVAHPAHAAPFPTAEACAAAFAPFQAEIERRFESGSFRIMGLYTATAT